MHDAKQVNTQSSINSSPHHISNILHVPKAAMRVEFTEEYDFSKTHLSSLAWLILCETDAITRKYDLDYGYTSQEISDRLKRRGIKSCGKRNVEYALKQLNDERMIQVTERKNAPAYGKEKFRGLYRELSNKGKSFLLYRRRCGLMSQLQKADKIPNDDLKPKIAELIAELNGSVSYCGVASADQFHKPLDQEIRSTLDNSYYSGKDLDRDSIQSSFAEYEQIECAPKPKASEKPIYSQVLPKYRERLARAVEGSGLLQKGKERVIEEVLKYQYAGKEIGNITGFSNNLINKERQLLTESQKPNICGLVDFSSLPKEKELTKEECELRKKEAAERMKKIRELTSEKKKLLN